MATTTYLKGRLRNTRLPKTRGLFPVFEAVVNSIHAIEDRSEDQSSVSNGHIYVDILRDPQGTIALRDGPALRHRLAHGLISAGECYDTDSIYACWFIYRLCCLPLFPHWQHVARSLDSP